MTWFWWALHSYAAVMACGCWNDDFFDRMRSYSSLRYGHKAPWDNCQYYRDSNGIVRKDEIPF